MPLDLPIWPDNQKVVQAADPTILLTQFDDAPKFHTALSSAILKLSRSGSPFLEELMRGSCGTKVHHIDKWDCPEAMLVHNRACEMFRRSLKADAAHVDASWGNVYRRNDYCMPHSHIRAQASIVYMVDVGEESKDPLAGKLCFADPRIKYCAQHEPGRLTRILIPEMKPGSMIMFPGSVIHCVNPYFGQLPRITMSWNINAEAIPGDPRTVFDSKLILKQ